MSSTMRIPILVALLAAVANSAQPQQPRAAQRGEDPPEGVRVHTDIAYSGESPAQTLDLYLPEQDGSSLRPALVVVHGGGWRGGDKRRGQWARIPAEYARDGYVAISVNYRLTGEAPWPAQIEDVKAAVRWLRAHATEYRVDTGRIGAYGNSAGAHLVSLLGLVKKVSMTRLLKTLAKQ